MISDVHFPRVNGVSTSIQTFRHQLARLGHETLLIAPEYGLADPESPGSTRDSSTLVGESDVIRVPSHRVLFDPEDRRMELRPILQHLPELRRRQFDLIHIQTPFV